MAKIEISAKLRNVAGKGAVREIRNNKNIPAVIYGNKIAPVAIELDGHSFCELIKKPGLRTKLFVIDTGKIKENTMLVGIQYHVVKDTPTHVDFKRIDITKPISVNVPLNLVNTETAKGIKAGGALNFAVRSVSLVAKIDSIPEKIDVDLKNLGLTETIHGCDLRLPDNVELDMHQAELAFVTIAGKMKEEEASKVAATASVAPASGASPATSGAEKPAAQADFKKLAAKK